MKHLKSIIAAALTMFVALAVSVTAFAAEITIDPANPNTGSEDPTYTYYVMMKASVGANGTAYYVETKALADALDGLKVGEDDLFTVTAAGTNHWNVTVNKKGESGAFTGEEIAAALATIKSQAIATGTASDNKFSIEGDGYVLVESSLGTKLVLDTMTEKTIVEKNTYPGLEKTEDVSSAEIGGTVTYEIPITIPETVAEKPIKVTDVITKGLTLNTAITADNGVTGLAWTQEGEAAADGSKTYTVTIPAATVKSLAGKTLTLTYTATVNELAVVKTPEINKAKLEYDNFTSVETEPVKVETFGFELYKTDGSKALAGVKFTLTNAAGKYYTEGTDDTDNNEARFLDAKNEVVTPEDGKITFAGLAAGTYTLTETETVPGFNKLTEAITVTIDANGNATFTGADVTSEGTLVTVVNNSGTVLPSTGGMGTTMFYVIGGLMVAGAAIALIAKNRVAKMEA